MIVWYCLKGADGMNCEATDITEQTFGLLRRKRAAAVKHRAEFEAEGIMDW